MIASIIDRIAQIAEFIEFILIRSCMIVMITARIVVIADPYLIHMITPATPPAIPAVYQEMLLTSMITIVILPATYVAKQEKLLTNMMIVVIPSAIHAVRQERLVTGIHTSMMMLMA